MYSHTLRLLRLTSSSSPTTIYQLDTILLLSMTASWPWFTASQLRLAMTDFSKSKSNSKLHCDWRSVNQYVMTRYVLLFDSYGLVFVGAPSLTRGRVCLFDMLMALVVFLGSESLGTRDHILLSQIWDFPFRRLLRLARSRWRYSNPPPHGSLTSRLFWNLL
jgi:hypothetical protein